MPAVRGLAVIALLSACLIPLLVLGAELFAEGSLSTLRSTLGEARSWDLLLRSLGLALAITLGATAVGVPMGVLLGRCDVTGRRAAFWLHLFPVFLPPFLLALGWFQVFGAEGLVGSAWTSGLLFGRFGTVATLAFAFAPVITTLTALGLKGIDPSIEEAARVVSPSMRVVTHILLPLALPSIAFGAIVVFALALSEIGVPMFLHTRTYTAAIFARLGGVQYAPGEALALVLPLFGIGLLLVTIDRLLLGQRFCGSLGLRHREDSSLRLGAARPFATAVVWMVIMASLLPIGTLMLKAGVSGFLDARAWLGSSMRTSLISSVLSASGIVLIGLVLGHALARRSFLAPLFDALALLTFMAPASALGAGLIAAWNRPETQIIYTTMAILVLGLVSRYAVIGIRIAAAIFSQSSPVYEEAAASFGGGFMRRMISIVVPMHGRAIASAWLITIIFCLRDLDTVIVFYPPGLEPLVVRIFTLEANGPEHVVAALAMYHVLLTAFFLLALGLVLRRLRRYF